MSNESKTPGAFDWCELVTRDVESAKAFYRDLLGWTLEDMPMFTGQGTYTLIKAGGATIGGILPTPPHVGPLPPTWGPYVTVDDVDVVAAKVEALGGSILVPPTDIPSVGRICWFKDPQGAAIAMIAYD